MQNKQNKNNYKEYYLFLDSLKELNIKTWEQAPAYLMNFYDLDEKTATKIFIKWAKNKVKTI